MSDKSLNDTDDEMPALDDDSMPDLIDLDLESGNRLRTPLVFTGMESDDDSMPDLTEIEAVEPVEVIERIEPLEHVSLSQPRQFRGHPYIAAMAQFNFRSLFRPVDLDTDSEEDLDEMPPLLSAEECRKKND
jgi:hypothetical protein